MATNQTIPGLPGVSHEYATLNGRKYHYLLGLPSDAKFKRTIFLVHGFPDCSYGWRRQFQPLMDIGLRVVALDVMGYSQTEAPRAPPEPLNLYSFKQAADDINELAKQLGESSIVLGGHDWGGAIVYRVYQYYPKLISHVFSICVPYFPPSREFMSLEDFVEALPHFGYQLQLASGEVENKLTTKDDMRSFLNALFGGSGDAFDVKSGIKFENLTTLKKTKLLSEAELEYYATEYSRTGLHGPCNWYKTRKVNFDNDIAITNPFIEIPTLFIAAKKDPTIPEMMYAHIEKFIPDLTLRAVNTHHWAMIEDPNGVNKIITEWIKEVVFAGKAKF